MRDPLALRQQLCLPLYAASRALIRAYGPLLETLGLTYPQYLVMLALWEESPLQLKDLGERLHLDSGTLTPLLKRLEGAGLVIRRRDDADERRLFLELTQKGRALRSKAEAIPGTLRANIPMGGRALQDLKAGLESLIVALTP
jgi:DNA-binding MarR family transcriptional regulator